MPDGDGENENEGCGNGWRHQWSVCSATAAAARRWRDRAGSKGQGRGSYVHDHWPRVQMGRHRRSIHRTNATTRRQAGQPTRHTVLQGTNHWMSEWNVWKVFILCWIRTLKFCDLNVQHCDYVKLVKQWIAVKQITLTILFNNQWLDQQLRLLSSNCSYSLHVTNLAIFVNSNSWTKSNHNLTLDCIAANACLWRKKNRMWSLCMWHPPQIQWVSRRHCALYKLNLLTYLLVGEDAHCLQ